jgi:hypothetical protein
VKRRHLVLGLIHGRYKVQGYFIGCDENDPSNVLSITIRAHGPLSY